MIWILIIETKFCQELDMAFLDHKDEVMSFAIRVLKKH